MVADIPEVELTPETRQELDSDYQRLWDPPTLTTVLRDEIRRMIHNGVKGVQAESRDREDFELDHWDPNLQTIMTSEQRRERAQRLVLASREIEERRRIA